MTILEQQVYNVVAAIEAEKMAHNIHPQFALLVADRVAEQVDEQVDEAMGMDNHPSEIKSALLSLEQQGYIRMGNTINDTYIQTTENE